MIVTMDCYAYGESAEAGHEPKIRAGVEVVETGPREMQPNGHEVTYVFAGRRIGSRDLCIRLGSTHRVLVAALQD